MNGLQHLVFCLCMSVHVNMVLGTCTKHKNVFVLHVIWKLSSNTLISEYFCAQIIWIIVGAKVICFCHAYPCA